MIYKFIKTYRVCNTKRNTSKDSHFSMFSVWLENSNLSDSVKTAFQYSFGLYVPISYVEHFTYILENCYSLFFTKFDEGHNKTVSIF